MKKPHILVFFKRKGKQLLGVDHLTFEGGLGCGRFEKKNPAKTFKQRKTLPSEKKNYCTNQFFNCLPPPPPSLKVKWSKLISGHMDFGPHIKKVRLSSHSPFTYKRYNENLFLAAADDVLGRIFCFSFDPVRPSTLF